jgi:hypothetical protein
MVSQKNAEPGLSGLTSTSLTAKWRLLFFIASVAIKIVEDLFDVHVAQVEERAAEIPVGTLKWYARESLNFQFGDTLLFQDGKVEYAEIDEDKQLVKLSSATIENGLTTIKVAALDGSGNAIKLEDKQVGSLAAFNNYWIDKRFSGTAISVVSIDPDLMKCYYRINYDPQVLAPDGSLLSDGSTFPVEDAINNFLQTFQSANFDDIMRVMKLTDAIQNAQGIINAVAEDVQAKVVGGDYIDVLADLNEQYVSKAGYMKIDPAFQLSTTLTYVSG